MDVRAILRGIVSRSLPQPSPEGQDRDVRLARYGSVVVEPVIPDYYALCDEGSYFVATNPTISTGISFGGAARTSFSDTDGGIAIINQDANPSSSIGKRVFLDYIKLICTTAPTGTIATPFTQFAMKLDNVQSRYASGGSQIIPVSPNMDVSSNCLAKIMFGALTFAAASSAARLVARGVQRAIAAAPGVDDVFIFNFGSVEKSVVQNLAATAGNNQFVFSCPPVALGPNHVFTMHQWATGQTAAPVYEFEMGWWER